MAGEGRAEQASFPLHSESEEELWGLQERFPCVIGQNCSPACPWTSLCCPWMNRFTPEMRAVLWIVLLLVQKGRVKWMFRTRPHVHHKYFYAFVAVAKYQLNFVPLEVEYIHVYFFLFCILLCYLFKVKGKVRSSFSLFPSTALPTLHPSILLVFFLSPFWNIYIGPLYAKHCAKRLKYWYSCILISQDSKISLRTSNILEFVTHETEVSL